MAPVWSQSAHKRCSLLLVATLVFEEEDTEGQRVNFTFQDIVWGQVVEVGFEPVTLEPTPVLLAAATALLAYLASAGGLRIVNLRERQWEPDAVAL